MIKQILIALGFMAICMFLFAIGLLGAVGLMIGAN